MIKSLITFVCQTFTIPDHDLLRAGHQNNPAVPHIRHATIWALHYFCSMSKDKIAGLMGIQTTYVRSIISAITRKQAHALSLTYAGMIEKEFSQADRSSPV